MTKIHKKRVNMNNLLDKIKEISNQFSFDWRVIAAFIEVETGGKGFNSDGKIMIQFEPSWFKRYVPNAPAGIWSTNKVDVQSKEWKAFNNAFAINKEAAMLSTSIGLGQIMGFHYKRLGYKTVGGNLHGDLKPYENDLLTLGDSSKRWKNIYGVLGDFTTLIASTSVVTPKVIFSSGGWSIEQLGTEIQFKYNDTIKQRFLSDGSIIATGDVIEFG